MHLGRWTETLGGLGAIPQMRLDAIGNVLGIPMHRPGHCAGSDLTGVQADAWMHAKFAEITQQLRRRLHGRMSEVGAWLQ